LLRLDKWPKGKLATKFMQWLRTPAKTFRSGAKLKYFYQDLDSAGQRQNRYTVTFPKDQNALASMAAAASTFAGVGLGPYVGPAARGAFATRNAKCVYAS